MLRGIGSIAAFVLALCASAVHAQGQAPPKCWADLANPIYKDEVQMANPNASGTAYSTIATFVQIFGEDKAFELLKGMHRNTNNYPRGRAGRNVHRRHVPARRPDRDRERLSGEDRGAV